jgi:hypothetical protein
MFLFSIIGASHFFVALPSFLLESFCSSINTLAIIPSINHCFAGFLLFCFDDWLVDDFVIFFGSVVVSSFLLLFFLVSKGMI